MKAVKLHFAAIFDEGLQIHLTQRFEAPDPDLAKREAELLFNTLRETLPVPTWTEFLKLTRAESRWLAKEEDT